MSDEAIIIFDGACGFCHAGIRRIARNDRDGVFRFCPSQSELGQRLLSEFHLPQPPMSIVVVHEGVAETNSDALMTVARKLGGIYVWAATFASLIPKGVRDWAYQLIAVNRYRLAGRVDACEMPEDWLTSRLVTS